MSIIINDLLSVINKTHNPSSDLERIMLDYAILLEKLNNIDEQSFLFKKGLENNKLKLDSLKKGFNEIKEEINSSTIDDLILKQKEFQERIKDVKNVKYFNTISMIAVSSFESNLSYIEELIRIKSRVDFIENIDYYFESKEALLKLLGYSH